MDYKEKYEAALSWMKKIYPTLTGSDKEDAEHYFPELTESEDERIKNLIYCIVRDRSDVGKLLEANGCPVEKALSWIEEQKEPKLESCDCSRDEESYTNGIHHVLMNPEAYGLIKQKPAEWSEEDEENFKWFDKLFRAESVVVGGREIPQDKYQWFKSLRPQPKVELTLLDENIINAAVAFVEQNDHFNCWRGVDKHTVIKALRTLKPHWEPSKKQMEALEKVRTIFHNNHLWDEITPILYDYEELMRDLESLRSRPKASDNWKPSEEQMGALKNAINDVLAYYHFHNPLARECDEQQFKMLESLYNDLKKL